MSIGIFWYWNDQVISIAHSFSLLEADSIGFIDSSYTHVDYWSVLQKEYRELNSYEYEQIPRGRIIFDTNKEKYLIYLDRTLLYKSKLAKLCAFFNLEENKVIPKTDPHYRIF